MRTRNALGAMGLVAVLTILGACGGSSGSSAGAKSTPTSAAPEVSPAGDISDTQAYVPYSPAAGGYTVSVPEGWARTDQTNGAVFSDKFNSIRIEQTAAATAPTTASVQADVVPQIRAEGGTAIAGASKVTRKGGDAIRITYFQDSAADATTGKKVTLAVERYLFWKNGSLVSITLSAPKGSDNVDPWRTITDGFAWTA
ncbi:MAG: hypothetical protein JWL73_1883 [Actinomycetia bacterium]|nr:hypothetical protein [Actinomycetes bacterium]